ncbi:hypothetical protein B0H14DRAFT_1158723 [Mycena olivaceomarginata]|nr:hypothetical protein B0H14DRAFT_1158723 [Mycena olivaceomarginata]
MNDSYRRQNTQIQGHSQHLETQSGEQTSRPLPLTQLSWSEPPAVELRFVAVNPWGPSRRLGRSTPASGTVVARPTPLLHVPTHVPAPVGIISRPWTTEPRQPIPLTAEGHPDGNSPIPPRNNQTLISPHSATAAGDGGAQPLQNHVPPSRRLQTEPPPYIGPEHDSGRTPLKSSSSSPAGEHPSGTAGIALSGSSSPQISPNGRSPILRICIRLPDHRPKNRARPYL